MNEDTQEQTNTSFKLFYKNTVWTAAWRKGFEKHLEQQHQAYKPEH